MQKHQLYINLLTLTSALALSACVEEVVYVVNPDVPEVGEKTPIELSIGGVEGEVSASTRAVITNGTGNKNFTAGTSIFMLMKSEYEALTGSYAGYTYGGTDTADKYTTTTGKVKSDGESIEFVDDQTTTRTRYWNDAHARSSQLSIWAVACDGLNYLGGIGTSQLGETSTIFNNDVNAITPWRTTAVTATDLQWNVPHVGTGITVTGFDENSIKNRDLLFSNNVTKYTVNSIETDNRTKYDTGTKKFGSSALVFRHALSKIVVNIKKGAGYTTSDGFSFPSGKNIKLNYFNMWGKFNIEQGEFTVVNGGGGTGHAVIDYMYNKTNVENSSHAYELEALVLPYLASDPKTSYKGSQFTKDNTNVMMEFTIDNNTYQLTAGQLYTALHDLPNVTEASTQILLEAGKKYVFTFTVGKSMIDNISAKIVDWETIETSITPSNARIKLLLEERGDAVSSGVAIYKSEDNKTTDGVDDNYTVYNWETGYSNMNATYSTDHWTTDIYWRNSKEFYHFRALKPASTGVTTESTVGDYVSLTSGVSFTDVLWGAPMRDNGDNEDDGSFTWNYDFTSGFSSTTNTAFSGNPDNKKNQIYQAIGVTEDQIKLTLFHMMSDVTFNIKTTSDPDKVTLSTGDDLTKVTIVNLSPSAKVLLGNGCVIPNEKDLSDIISAPVARNTESSGTHVYKYGVVPQDLDGVQLYITTPDHNQYIVDLKDVKAATVNTRNIANPYSQSESKYVIDKWYPGFKYVYTFTLKKKGIADISATVVNWETVETDNEEVTIQ